MLRRNMQILSVNLATIYFPSKAVSNFRDMKWTKIVYYWNVSTSHTRN